MKNPWNDIIPLLPLQEFMSLTSIQGKLCASAPCFHLLRHMRLGYFTKFHPSCSAS
ncbi:hypothetical protein B296_00028082 [Ensete ventricosum]|uniref:Uncharacterized protein n=1 Tax=Ensete ventricosum TaxID=4639 RepID=A0A426Z058_ENSVE|nr:hypothetical protein B296_00028082 [Ensete ventricosum]